MKKLIFSALILLPCILSAQSAVRSNNSLTLNLIGIDYSYEQRLAGGVSLIARAGFGNAQGAIFDQNVPIGGPLKESEWDMGFAFAVEPRFYYNAGRRAKLGKNTTFNSFDFVAVEFRAVSNPVNRDYEAYYPYRAAVMWGMRRVYGKHWLVEGNAGLNIYQDKYDDIEFGPRLNARFGFVF